MSAFAITILAYKRYLSDSSIDFFLGLKLGMANMVANQTVL
jgi:hypothetical protein